MNNLLSFEQLKVWLGCKQDADVERKLKEHKIPYKTGIGGKPVTTIDAVNSVLLDSSKNEQKAVKFG